MSEMQNYNKLSAIIVLVIGSLLAVPALAQQRTIYDGKGRTVGQITTDSAGNKTIYGSDGRVIGRESTDSRGTITLYDAGGRKAGSVSPYKK